MCSAQDREDKLRALIPMLSIVAVEGHEELVSLIEHVLSIAPPGENVDAMSEELEYLRIQRSPAQFTNFNMSSNVNFLVQQPS